MWVNEPTLKEAQHCAHVDQGLQIVCNNFKTDIVMSFLHRTLELDRDLTCWLSWLPCKIVMQRGWRT
jgi:hypothetical protein